LGISVFLGQRKLPLLQKNLNGKKKLPVSGIRVAPEFFNKKTHKQPKIILKKI
jgi:hypothetical protein